MNNNENTDVLKLVNESNKSDLINFNVEENKRIIDSTLESIIEYLDDKSWDIQDSYWDNDLKVLNTLLDQDPDEFKKYVQVVKNRAINYLILYHKFNQGSPREEDKIQIKMEIARSFFENNVLGKEVFDPQNIDQDYYSIDIDEYRVKVEKCLLIDKNKILLGEIKQKHGQYLNDYQSDIEAIQNEDCLENELEFEVKFRLILNIITNRRTLDERIGMYVTNKENVEEFNQKKKEFSEHSTCLFTRIMLESRSSLYKKLLIN